MENSTVLFGNSKGGVGKSSLALMSAIYLAATRPGLRIAAADLDAQASMHDALRRFEDENLTVLNWSESVVGAGLERGRLLNAVQDAKQKSDLLIIDTPAGFSASELYGFIQPDLIITPLTPSDADIFATRRYLQELTETIEQEAAASAVRKPRILAIPNQVYSAECESRVRDCLRGLHLRVGRPVPHLMEFRDIFRYAEGDRNIGRVMQKERKFFAWLGEQMLGPQAPSGPAGGNAGAKPAPQDDGLTIPRAQS